MIRESSEVAYTIAKAYMARIDPLNTFFKTTAIHLHLPGVDNMPLIMFFGIRVSLCLFIHSY